MSDSLFSSSWYRVSALLPQLAADTRVHRHTYRGQLWYVLEDPASGRSHRMTPSAYRLIGLMNGQRSVEQIWQTVSEQMGDDAPTQDETIRTLGMLQSADMLRCDVSPDAEQVLRGSQRRERAEWTGRYGNPLAVRVPLLDPDRWLARWAPWVRPIFGRAGAVLWCVVVGAALVQMLAHREELSADAVSQFLALDNLLLLGVVYPLVKVLHELGHAFATRVRGGEVHEVGVLFLVLMPVPYVDASASSVFPDKRDRMLVAGAGILVEVFLAALAFFVWLNTEPGLARSIAYNVMWIGGVSTLLFNGNPLLRFDGYYVLSDAIEIPNLAARSDQYLAYLTLRRGFGLDSARCPANAPGEPRWFVFYGVAAALYRLFVLLAIAWFLSTWLPTVGVLLAGFAITKQVVLPLIKRIDFLLTSPRLGERRGRALLLSGSLAAALAGFVLVLPMPLSTRAQGVVWPPEGAQVRAHSEGFVVGSPVASETRVATGQALIEIRDASLEARIAILQARLAELRARRHAEQLTDRVRAQITDEEISALRAELERAERRLGEITLRSPASGTFFAAQAIDLDGHWVEQGELMGYVVSGPLETVRVVVPESHVTRVRTDTHGVELRLASRPHQMFLGKVLRVVPAATDRLPSPALGAPNGGRLAVDPTDPDGLRTLEKVFEVDIALPADGAAREIGGRVYVRFRHAAEPLIARTWRALMTLLVRDIGV